MSVLLVISAVIYLMAFRLRLSPEQAQAYIEESMHEAQVDDEQLSSP